MKTGLMHPFDRETAPEPSAGAGVFAADIGLDVVIGAAAGGDRYLTNIMSTACTDAWRNDLATIRHRQAILKDAIANPSMVHELYTIVAEPFQGRRDWDIRLSGESAATRLQSGSRVLQSCLEVLGRLRKACTAHAGGFTSAGLHQLAETLAFNLDDAYLAAAHAELEHLTSRKAVLLSAGVGGGGRAAGIELHRPNRRDLSWLAALTTSSIQGFTLKLHPRDGAGARAFNELQGRGLSLISDAVYQSAEHVLGVVKALRAELAFYVGALNLKDRLDQIGETFAFPEPLEQRQGIVCRNLRDPGLALTMGRQVVGNDVDAEGKSLVLITGANRGGKSTFLRSVGLAQAMMQCGLFVTADAFASSVRTGLFTHYRREEDRSMRSGKFDEELARMSALADFIRPGALVLFNESFAATHEREGAEVAHQVVSALMDSGVTVVFVTHMCELARAFLPDVRVHFLRAERGEEGDRNFQLRVEKPSPRSFGTDLYFQIFRRV